MSGTRRPEVLIVDDDETIRHVLGAALQDEGVAVSQAHNGREALEMIRQRPPSIIVLDLMMPEMSGWEVLDRLKKGPHAQIRVVVVSGSYGLDAMKPDPRADAVFEKPFNLGDVIETVIRLCDGGVDPGL